MDKTLKDINKEFEEFLKILPNEFDKNNIRNAYEYAKKKHIYQQRVTGEPYIAHPLEVARIVNSVGLDETSIVAALLHDVVEDTDGNFKEIKDMFGDEVEMVVDGLTKITTFGKKTDHVNVEALRKILLASAKDIRILIIKLCDRLHNLRTIDTLPQEKKERIATETLSIYAPIAQKVGIYSLKWELEDLSLKYINPEMYQFIKKKVNLKREEREKIVDKAVKEIKTSLEASGVKAIVLGRPKNFYSIYKKIRNKAKEFNEIYDLYAIRVIVDTIPQCYTVLGVLHDKFQSFPNRLKDYISNPKSNGYQSIHTIVFSNAIKSPIEIQIRTEDMHKLAEFGIAAHWRYKSMKEDKKFEKKIGWLREVLQWEKEHKDNTEFLKLLKFDFFEDEIFVFSPINDVFLLPDGSTVLDYAFAVHTELGCKAYKAKVNGVAEPIDKELKSGDIVEVITNKSVKPTEKWLKFVKTNKARIKIRQAINLKHSGKRNEESNKISFDVLKEKITRINEFKKVRKAGCCDFEYGDQLVGIIGKSKELIIHNASCENAKYSIQKKIQLRWIEEKEKEVTIIITMKDRIGLLMDILNIFSNMNINILKLNSKVLKSGDVKQDIVLLDGPHIDKLVRGLKKIDAVVEVKVSRGLFG